ncbi:MotA/TolQ/ExbB proton channel family protein [Chitinibacter bivalviorum]|uniref:Biopolymer transport protein ExbB n=1 Tax=Chitinibacter bivalviorum TaxID=2739434 RepID=A0A7H9BHA9_9NEIS|nr:MotA/TolQ/ExbB proton channel family protein [Chitinibacter bivalviorum]QLG87341.1 MotA/TolQ/ExbB proton channel family protein [Chitinibacter bivalviorum]
MDLSLVLHSGDPILQSVFGLLVLMSIVSWVVIIARSRLLWIMKRHQQKFMSSFWEASDWQEALSLALKHKAPAAKLARAGADGLRHYRAHEGGGLGKAVSLDDYLVRNLRTKLSQETAKMERGLTWLATTGSVAPFIGLFGTVWGIYHALVGIATSGNASLTTVAAPIGEALVATAAGLAVAIPAVIAYNAFIRSNRRFAQELDGFTHDLHAQLLTEGGHGIR